MTRTPLLLLASLGALLVGCGGAEEDPETAARLDALRCPSYGTSSFYLDATVSGLEPFEAEITQTVHGVLPPTTVWTRRGDVLVLRDEIGLEPGGVELTVADATGGERRFCGGEGSARRERRQPAPAAPEVDEVQVRVLLQDVRIGPDCETRVAGDIGVCFTN